MSDRIKFLARFKVETATPLGVGSGEVGLVNDRLVAKDANDLPYIPGTSLAGVVRHEMEQHTPFADKASEMFGYQLEDKGMGSRLIFSSAILLATDNKTVLEGLRHIDRTEGYYSFFKRLPERDHVRISHKGTAVKHGKFEEELVHKGTRFVFEIELDGHEGDQEFWKALLAVLHRPTFRIGAGTRKGFGELEVIECTERVYRLKDESDLNAYLNQSSSLNDPIEGGQSCKSSKSKEVGWHTYDIKLNARDFFLFGSGLFQEDVHNAPKTESYFVWEKDGPKLTEPQLLIPATSIKGAISHRVAYHYNSELGVSIEEVGLSSAPELPEFDLETVLSKFTLGLPVEELNFAENARDWKDKEMEIDTMTVEGTAEWQEYLELLDELKRDEGTTTLPVGEQNLAVAALFGFAKDSKNKLKSDGARGKVIFSDIYLEKKEDQLKVLNHVAIDRFTGGAIDGALFQEQVVKTDDTVSFQLFVEADAFADPNIKKAFENTLDDLVQGRLPIGGNTTKGHGVFSGEWSIV